MTRYLLTIAFTGFLFFCNAQVRIGTDSLHIVNPSAVLELSNNLAQSPANWKTFLPPQVDFTNAVFTSSQVWGVAGTPVVGAVVFNIGYADGNGFAGPGLYCWVGNRWLPIGSTLTNPGNGEDRLRQALGSSLTAYDTAADNSWVMVKESEYQQVLLVVSGASKYACTDSFMNLHSEIGWNQLYTVGGNASVSLIPSSNYIIAWSVRTGVNFPSLSEHSKIKVSSSQLTGYVDYGPSLPNYSLSADTRYFFILKKPQIATGPAPSYTAVYAFHAKFLGGRLATPGEYFTPGDSSGLNINYQSQSAAQFICTPIKQW